MPDSVTPAATAEPVMSRAVLVGQIRLGVATALPAALGIVPMGVAFGVLVSQAELPWWTATLFAAAIFAGSLEFLLIGLVTAMAPLGTIAITALVVNFRHVFYALSFPLARIRGRGWRSYSTFVLCDEAWALTSHPDAQRWTGARILALQITFHLCWVASATLGAVGGGLIPPEVVGLDFAVTAFFLVLGIDAYRARRSVPIPLFAVGCGILFAFVAGDGMILPAVSAFVGLLLLAFLVGRRRSQRA